jgi:hypothetical protein
MGGNKIVYKEAFELARAGRPRPLLQRILFPFQDHYTQSSRLQGERDGAAARVAELAGTEHVPAATVAQI